MKRSLPICFCIFILNISIIYSQASVTDSIFQLIEIADSDTSKISKIIEFANASYILNPSRTDSMLNVALPLIQGNDRYKIERFYHYKCALNIQLGRPDSGAIYGNKFLNTLNKEQDSSAFIIAYNNIGVCEEMLGNFDKAAFYYNECLDLTHALNDTLRYSIIYTNLGLVYDAQGNLNKAMDHFLKAYSGFKTLNHLGGQSATLTNLGKVYTSNGNFEEAIKWFRQGVDIDEELNRQKSLSIKIDNIGACYEQMGKLDSAMIYFDKSIEIKKGLKNERGIGISYSNIAKIQNLRKEYSAALETAQTAIELSNKTKDTRTESVSHIEAGKASLGLQKSTQSKNHFLSALNISKKTGEIGPLKNAYQKLYEIEKTQNPSKALDYLEQAVIYKDSLINRENIEELATLKMEHEFSQKELLSEQEIALLQSQQKITKLQLSNATRTNFGLGFGLFLLSLFAYTIFKQRNKIKAKNSTINKALEEREILLKEIHHRVKNNLQVISALLTLQANHLKDTEAKEALHEGQDRVHSMALIHKDLYQHDNLKGVNAKEYLEQLTQNLLESYNIDDEVILKTDIQEIWLDVDTMIPMGLMVNELISNALKHAFEYRKDGILSIHLNEINDRLILKVSDNGQGVHDIEKMKSKSFGYSLIQSFSRKLKADIDFEQEKGLAVSIAITNYKKVG